MSPPVELLGWDLGIGCVVLPKSNLVAETGHDRWQLSFG
jgi:hypothetical protein